MVIETLRNHGLYAKASNRQVRRSFVGLPGHVISASDVIIDPRKVAVTAE